jgi:hypothetical protein
MIKNKIKILEKKKLLQEYSFIKSDLNYKKIIIEDSQSEFMEIVYDLLGKERKSIEKPEKNNKIANTKAEFFDESTKNKAKKLYREISKKTHPDKDPTGIYSDIFKQAAIYYEECKLLELFELCDVLGIDYTIEDNEIKAIKEEIENKKNLIKQIEQSFIYLWIIYEDENKKKSIIDEFIKKVGDKL